MRSELETSVRKLQALAFTDDFIIYSRHVELGMCGPQWVMRSEFGPQNFENKHKRKLYYRKCDTIYTVRNVTLLVCVPFRVNDTISICHL